MLWGAHLGGLELRTEGGETRLRATFPYGRATVLTEGGRNGQTRKEVIAPRAFAARIDAGEDIHFLAGHDYEKPLASRAAGTLTLKDTAAALIMEAVISAELRAVSYIADFLAAQAAGLITGLSPGFRVLPDPGAETVEVQRDGSILRTVRAAQLFELSAVTRPAYPEAQIEARSWQATTAAQPVSAHPMNRWRL
ncbi:HK97 family phage prohead protease [Rhodobacter capsulatus]|uniref:HK97 family phage prohead protease n=1 Tax=Rhodobacter capsulatus TaxID=1061 RepID=UPI0040262E20